MVAELKVFFIFASESSRFPEHSTLGDAKSSSISVRVRLGFSFGFFFTFGLLYYSVQYIVRLLLLLLLFTEQSALLVCSGIT